MAWICQKKVFKNVNFRALNSAFPSLSLFLSMKLMKLNISHCHEASWIPFLYFSRELYWKEFVWADKFLEQKNKRDFKNFDRWAFSVSRLLSKQSLTFKGNIFKSTKTIVFLTHANQETILYNNCGSKILASNKLPFSFIWPDYM